MHRRHSRQALEAASRYMCVGEVDGIKHYNSIDLQDLAGIIDSTWNEAVDAVLTQMNNYFEGATRAGAGPTFPVAMVMIRTLKRKV